MEDTAETVIRMFDALLHPRKERGLRRRARQNALLD